MNALSHSPLLAPFAFQYPQLRFRLLSILLAFVRVACWNVVSSYSTKTSKLEDRPDTFLMRVG